ncbi:MAG: TonB-dependent receptor [Chitinophagales bacterium]|nr:TonB-dependent receptor [Chitinophagales bacterium]
MKILLFGMLIFASALSSAQNFTLKGKVVDTENNLPLEGATVLLMNSQKAAVSDTKGNFRISNLNSGKIELRASFIGYQSEVKIIDLYQDMEVLFTLNVKAVLTDEVIVSSTRVESGNPTTFSNVTQEEIAVKNNGKDLPFLLDEIPSAVVTSDAGAGVGYTGLRLRGSDPSRINVTINGIPLNDAESQTVFWVNMPDFASSVQSIQVQRGIGTSTNGAGAFGGSVNIKTSGLNKDAYAEIDEGFGSFNTFRHSLTFGTGLIKNRFSLDGRLSKIKSDGYIDRASSDLQSLFISGTFYDDNTIIKGNIMLGKEVTYQAWYGVFEGDLATNRTFNLAGTDFYAKAIPYNNEVDNYRQDHYQLLFSQVLSEVINLNIGFHYTRGMGYFEQYKVGQFLPSYNISPPVVGSDTVFTSDLIRQRWLDNDFYGSTFSFEVEKGAISLTMGGAWNRYVGDHFGEVIWAEYSGNSEIGHRFYDNTGTKRDFNIYGKASYSPAVGFGVFADMQIRSLNYEVEGIDIGNRVLSTENKYFFFNPKLGMRYVFDTDQSVYTSIALANREPVRNDIIDAPSGQNIKPEKMIDIEAGYRYDRNGLKLQPNVYAMIYKDQLVLTGQLNDVGTAIRTNVDKSYRIGIEALASYAVSDKLSFRANLTYSSNKIIAFQEVINTFDDNYVAVDSLAIINKYENTDISFSPSIIGAFGIHIEAIPNLFFDLTGKYVGKQFLDNTSQDSRSLDPYFTNDLYIKYVIEGKYFEELGLKLAFHNLFDVKYESNGYTFSERYVSTDINQNMVLSGPFTYNYYYPQAGFHIMAGISLRF